MDIITTTTPDNIAQTHDASNPTIPEEFGTASVAITTDPFTSSPSAPHTSNVVSLEDRAANHPVENGALVPEVNPAFDDPFGTSKQISDPILDTSSPVRTVDGGGGEATISNFSTVAIGVGAVTVKSEFLSSLHAENGDQHTNHDEINGKPVVVTPPIAPPISGSTITNSSDTVVSLPPPPPIPPPPPRQPKSIKSPPSSEKNLKQLESELAAAKSMIGSLQKQLKSGNDGMNGDSLLVELQQKLQQQMSDKAEAENKARLAEHELQELRKQILEQRKEFENYKDLEQALGVQVTARAEAENDASMALKRLEQVESQADKDKALLEQVQKDLVAAREEMALQQQEVDRIREQRNDQERKEIALTNRLNEAKKKEADKANLAEQFEEDFKNVQDELALAQMEIQELRTVKAKLEHDLEVTRKNAAEKLHHAETALTDERRLNDDRKQKMKAFIEKKSEELRQAKVDNDSLQNEVNQTSKSLVDLNQRWKQLHAQWVQSQTRNRELQRDLNRIKKDSENLHKVGDTLEMKLSRSANETEEHKNKRLAAKHELMTVLRTLEAEREVTARLRDSIKFTFTPKALSQQQLLKESVEDFETQLLHLSRRLGKPLPPVTDADASESTTEEIIDDQTAVSEIEAGGNRSEVDAQRLISKLDHETQRVSHCIMAFTGGIERLHLLLDASGDRTCFTVLNELIASGGGSIDAQSHNSAHREETTSITGQATRGLTAVRSHQYGQISGTPSRR